MNRKAILFWASFAAVLLQCDHSGTPVSGINNPAPVTEQTPELVSEQLSSLPQENSSSQLSDQTVIGLEEQNADLCLSDVEGFFRSTLEQSETAGNVIDEYNCKTIQVKNSRGNIVLRIKLEPPCSLRILFPGALGMDKTVNVCQNNP